MVATGKLVEAFYGRDPLRGEDAYLELLRLEGGGAIETLIPLGGASHAGSTQVCARLKAVAETLGTAIIPRLTRAIAEGSWGAKLAASPCFAAFECDPHIEVPLIAVLEKGGNFDAERIAIEALGYLGASRHASALAEYAKRGSWPPDFDGVDHISEYPFEKLSSYVLEAIARFAARCRRRDDARSLFRILTDFIHLRQRQLPNRAPDAYGLVGRHGGEFTGWTIDPIIAYWGRSSDEELRRLCLEILGTFAPRRAARFLLGIATDPSVPEMTRRSASNALGELRHPHAAELLAHAIRNSSTAETFLDWAFSTLRSVPVDWSGSSDRAERILAERSEESAQLAYSLALSGDHCVQAELIRRLDDPEPFQRWAAALALARLLGPQSRPYLEHLADESGDELERCGILAAGLRAGDVSAAERLHVALQELSTLPQLRSVWKLEIIDSFRTQNEFDARAFRVWKTAAGVTPRQLQYFEALAIAEACVERQLTQRPVRERVAKPPRMFISYSHDDRQWLERFQVMLDPLVASERIEVWDDTRITSGEWRKQIERAMSESHIALFLVTARFLASDFVKRHELPQLLEYAIEREVKVVWVLVDDCLWEESPLVDYHGLNIDQPLASLVDGKKSEALKRICLHIRDLLPAS